MRKWELGHLLWRERKNSSPRIGVPYLLFHFLWHVGFQVLCVVTRRRTQSEIGVGFSTCSVSIGRVLQNNWRAAVVTKSTLLPCLRASRMNFNDILRLPFSQCFWVLFSRGNCTYLSLSYGLFSSSHSAGGRSESLTSGAATSKASPGTLKLEKPF